MHHHPEKWNIIPIKKNSKLSSLKWRRYVDEKFPIAKLKEHDGNLGVICGKISGNLIIIDLDYKDNNKQYYKKIFSKFYEEYPQLASTYIEETPNGHHFFYYIKGECPSRLLRQDTDKEKVLKWLSTGAKPTETVERLLAKSGIIEKKEKPVKTKVKAKKKKVEAKPEVDAENTNKETSE